MAFSYFDQLSQNTNKFVNIEPMIEFNGITTRLYSEIARENLKMMNELMQCGVEQLQGLSHARGLEEVLSIHSKTMAKAAPQLFQHTQQILDTLVESAGEYSRIFEKGIQKASQTQEKYVRDIKDIKDNIKDKVESKK